MAKSKDSGLQKAGTVAYQIEGDMLHIFIPFDSDTIKKAGDSKSGKMKEISNSGGFKLIEGTPLSLNVYAGVKNK